MSFSTKPIATRCDLLRTVAAVITAACLLTMTIGFLVAGTYTVKTVATLQSTYHPERLASIMNTAAEAAESFHKTTHLLGDSHRVNILDDLHRLVGAAEEMSLVLKELPMDRMVEESKTWRLTSDSLLRGIKKTLDEF